MQIVYKSIRTLVSSLLISLLLLSIPIQAKATDNQDEINAEIITTDTEEMSDEITDREEVILGIQEKGDDELLGVGLDELTEYRQGSGSVDLQQTRFRSTGNPNLSGAQEWLNENYSGVSGYTTLDVDGTSYSTTYIAMVKAFQIELGMPVEYRTGIFGDMTKGLCPTFTLNDSSNSNMVKIFQYALLCKGYYDTNITGVFDTVTRSQIIKLQEDAGLSENQISNNATPTVIQAALSTEIYVLGSGGDYVVQEVQRALNKDYFDYIGIQPCDGIFGPSTVRSLILALQAEEGIPRRADVSSDNDIYANGYFGSTTRRLCPSIPYAGVEKKFNGSNYTNTEITRLTKLLQYSLYCHGVGIYNPGEFTGTLTTATVNALKFFQENVALPVTGKASLNEWMSLMVSTGNPNRVGTAIDCSTRLTAEKATALKNAGYTTVGRYLTGDLVIGGQRVAKNLLRSEMQTIFDANLNLFVIYQDIRQFFTEHPNLETVEDVYKVYFSPAQGRADAEKAFSVAKSLGVPEEEVIYFAVDYDFVKSEVYSMIIPYFEAINEYALEQDVYYRIGIYGARNTCQLVKESGYSSSSFVSDMSTGYSGNLGYALPDDWAFDQIQEFEFSSPDGSFGVDKNVMSGRYTGFNSFDNSICDEWDALSKESSTYVLAEKEGSPDEISVYWAKIYQGDGTFKAKYDTYDTIKKNDIFIIKEQTEVNSKDTVRRVYFRDKGGRINAGYVNAKDLKAFEVEKIQNCAVYSDGTIYPNANGDKNYKFEFHLTRKLSTYDQNGNYVGSLAKGSKVRLSSNAKVHKTYTGLLQISHQQPGGSGSWVEVNNRYINMDIEGGVSPKTRSLVSDSSDVPNSKKKAIYFLPGFLGSQLWKSEDDALAWADMMAIVGDAAWRKLYPQSSMKSTYLFTLDENGNGDKLKTSTQNDINSGAYGTVFPGGDDSAGTIMKNLQDKFGAEYEVKFFAYDWRKSLKIATAALEEDIRNNGFEEISLVCHSTGGLLGAQFIAQNKNRAITKIDKVVTLGTPLTGTYDALEVLETGNNKLFDEMGLGDEISVENTLKHTLMQQGLSVLDIRGWAKDVVNNAPCIYQLLPSSEFLSTVDNPFIYKENLFSENSLYETVTTTSQFYNMLNRSVADLNSSMIDGNGESHKKYRSEYLNGKNIMSIYKEVNAFHIAGVFTSSGASPTYKIVDESRVPLQFDGFSYETLFADGTVLLNSALGVYINNNGDKVYPENYIIVPGVKHFDLIIDENVFPYVEYFLKNGEVGKETQPRTTTTFSVEDEYDMSNRIALRVNGEVDIAIVDGDENIVATVTSSLFECDDDRFSYSYVNEETADLYIPRSGYKVNFMPREGMEADVEFSLIIKTLNSEGRISSAIEFSDVDALQSNDYIFLDAVQEINDQNIQDVNLQRNGTTEIPQTNIKTDFAQSLELDEQKTIGIGNTEQIVYNVTPENTGLVWSSSDEAIATVNENGQVTAVDYGYAQITVNTTDGNQVKTCYICVPYNASGISLESIYEIEVGERLLLQPEFIPAFATNTDVTYTSSNSTVAEVANDGLVIGKESGSATITVTTSNGKTATTKINVIGDSSIVNMRYVTINHTDTKYVDIGDSAQYTASIFPGNADYFNVKWQVLNTNVAVIEQTDDLSCTIRALGYGTTELKVIVTDGVTQHTETKIIEITRPNEVVVHYHNSKGWERPYINYEGDNSSSPQGGYPMLSEGNGWYTYKITGNNNANVSFHNNNGTKIPSGGETPYKVKGERWILNGNITNKMPGGIKIHYYNIHNWSTPYIYYYNDNGNTDLPWPGVQMGRDGGNNWYTYTIYGVENPKVIFNNNASVQSEKQQVPGLEQPGIQITKQEMWVVNQTATEEKPEGITVHFYRPSNWAAWESKIYFYEDNNVVMSWPGTLMTNVLNDDWLTYTIYGMNSPRVIFTNGVEQFPGKFQDGYLIEQDMWFKNGQWTTYKP